MTKLVNRGGGGRGGDARSSGAGRRPTAGSGWKDAFRETHKWAKRAGKAVKSRGARPTHPAMRLLAKSRELTAAEVRKMLAPVLQPVRAKYGGQGLAKPSAFVDIADANFSEILRRLYDEHVEGFSGKSYKKMGNVQDAMEWRVRLKAKAERDGTVLVKKKRESAASPRGGGGASPEDEAEGRTEKGKKPAGGGAHWSRSSATPAPRRALEEEEEEEEEENALEHQSAGGSRRGDGLSRKQRKKAAQMGLTPEAMLALQTSKVKVKVDESARESAIEAYRAMQRAKHRANGGGARRR